MGGRAAYTLATGIFIGLGGILGYIGYLADVLPLPALAPILVFIAIEMTTQSYAAVPARHSPAVTLALFPSIAYLVVIFLSQVHGGALLGSALDPAAALQQSGLTNPGFIQTCAVMVMLANGFIFAAMLWGGVAALMIDRAIAAAAALLFAAGVLSLFGFMHSVLPTGGVYLPWRMNSPYPYHWAVAYCALAMLLLILGRTRAFRESPPVAAEA